MKADGFSRPYIVAMALSTALYGFLGLFISFRFACLYTEERWAFLGDDGHLVRELPSGIHVLQSFLVARPLRFRCCDFLMVLATKPAGTDSCAMGNSGPDLRPGAGCHYANIALLLVPLLESLQGYWRSWRAPRHDWRAISRLFGANLLYCLCDICCVSAHTDHEEDHLWKSVGVRL